MKRLLQISLDTLCISMIQIISFNVLGLILDKSLVNMFILTYPIQYLFMILYYLFSVGPNVNAEKSKDRNIIYSNIIFGIVVGVVVLVFLIFNYDVYLKIMHVDVETFKVFTIYSFINMFYLYILKLILEKLYYDKQNKKANIISIFFNLFTLLVLTVTALLSSSQMITSFVTLFIMGLILFVIVFLNIKKFKFNLSIRDNVKYCSVGLIKNVAMCICYLIGLYNEFSFGIEYIIASNFIGLITDVQWDMISSIETAVHIDASKGTFNMKKHLKDGYKLLLLLISSSLLMMFILYGFYKPNLYIFAIYFIVQIIDLIFYPICAVRIHYLQINGSDKNVNIGMHTCISKGLRLCCSFIHSPYCTHIGQLVEMVYNYTYSKVVSKNIKELQIRS